MGGLAIAVVALIVRSGQRLDHRGSVLAVHAAPANGFPVLTAAGATHLRRAGRDEWEAIKFSSLVDAEDWVRTGPFSYVDLMLDAQNYVRIGPESEVRITAQGEAPGRGLWSVLSFEMIQGRLAAALHYLAGRQVNVITKNATMGVRGTVFSVTSFGEDTVLSVLEGSVGLAPAGDPTRPILVRPMEQAQITRDALKVLPLPEDVLRELEGLRQTRYFRPPEERGRREVEVAEAETGGGEAGSQAGADLGFRGFAAPGVPGSGPEGGPSRPLPKAADLGREAGRTKLAEGEQHRGETREERTERAKAEAREKRAHARQEREARDAKAAGGEKLSAETAKTEPKKDADRGPAAGEGAKASGTERAGDTTAGRADASGTAGATPATPITTGLLDPATLQEIRTLLETCRSEAERRTVGRCFSQNADPDFRLNDLSRDDLKTLIHRARDTMESLQTDVRDVSVNVQGDQAFVSFTGSAKGKFSDGGEVDRTHQFLVNMVRRNARWVALWARFF